MSDSGGTPEEAEAARAAHEEGDLPPISFEATGPPIPEDLRAMCEEWMAERGLVDHALVGVSRWPNGRIEIHLRGPDGNFDVEIGTTASP